MDIKFNGMNLSCSNTLEGGLPGGGPMEVSDSSEFPSNPVFSGSGRPDESSDNSCLVVHDPPPLNFYPKTGWQSLCS